MIDRNTAQHFLNKEVVVELENNKLLVGTVKTIGENSLLLVHPTFGPNGISYKEIIQIRLRENSFKRDKNG